MILRLEPNGRSGRGCCGRGGGARGSGRGRCSAAVRGDGGDPALSFGHRLGRQFEGLVHKGRDPMDLQLWSKLLPGLLPVAGHGESDGTVPPLVYRAFFSKGGPRYRHRWQRASAASTGDLTRRTIAHSASGTVPLAAARSAASAGDLKYISVPELSRTNHRRSTCLETLSILFGELAGLALPPAPPALSQHLSSHPLMAISSWQIGDETGEANTLEPPGSPTTTTKRRCMFLLTSCTTFEWNGQHKCPAQICVASAVASHRVGRPMPVASPRARRRSRSRLQRLHRRWSDGTCSCRLSATALPAALPARPGSTTRKGMVLKIGSENTSERQCLLSNLPSRLLAWPLALEPTDVRPTQPEVPSVELTDCLLSLPLLLPASGNRSQRA